MTTMDYQCTSCADTFEGMPAFAAHIKRVHEPRSIEDELEHVRRRALNLPDEDEDDDDDDAEDELLPTSLPLIIERVAYLQKTAALLVAERNHRGLETLRAELDALEPHLRIISDTILRTADDARAVLAIVDWVLHTHAAVIP